MTQNSGRLRIGCLWVVLLVLVLFIQCSKIKNLEEDVRNLKVKVTQCDKIESLERDIKSLNQQVQKLKN